MELKERLGDALDEMSDADYVNLYNEIAIYLGRNENVIYYMDEVDSVLDMFTPSGLIQGLDREFSLNDDYFTITDRDEIYSFTDLLDDKCPADRDEMIQVIVSVGDSFGNSDIEEVLYATEVE